MGMIRTDRARLPLTRDARVGVCPDTLSTRLRSGKGSRRLRRRAPARGYAVPATRGSIGGRLAGIGTRV